MSRRASADHDQAPSKPIRASTRARQPSSRTASKKDDLYVVGIGASAGGLEALRPFVANLPTSANLCFVVAQHLSPQHRSMMVELLSRETKIPVVAINNGVSIKPNTIYIAPPNSDVFYRTGKLVLRAPLESVGPKPSIDHLFNSMATGLGARAIAIVLSGTGSDGANGLRAVKAHGGITFAQEPSSAKYDSMPRAAMTIGGADLILPPKEIAGKLAVIAQGHKLHLGLAEKIDDAGATFQTIIRYIRRQTGIDFSKYKEATLRRQIARRMSALQIGALKDYITYIENHRDEIDTLTKNFLISVTSFFRDKEAFAALGKALDKIIKDKRNGEALRIWVPGCATGEEAYSIALLLATKARTRLNGLRVQIFGTDIDGHATGQARRGEYAESSVINLKGNILHNYFVNNGRLFRIDKTIRDMVMFSRHDVAQDPPFKNMDLISCRNLLIYFKPTVQEHIFKLFHYALRPGGYLFLGKSESLGGCKSLFTAVDARHKMFRRRDITTRPYFVPRAIGASPEHEIELPVRRAADALDQDMGRVGRDVLIERYGPPSILISQDGDPVHFFGDVSKFVRLGSSGGKVDLNLITIIDPGLRAELRVLLHRARRDQSSQYGPVRVGKDNDPAIRMAVHPIERTRSDERLFLVSFEEREVTPMPSVISVDSLDDTTAQQIAALEQELKATKENLQTVVEELETSNEELQSANEELQATNEELQASNEELETSNEELQATNEELTTVNDELSVKTNDLAEANSELEGIMANSAEGIILFDPMFRIVRCNEKAARILQFSVGPDQLHLTDVTAFDGSANARVALENALKNGTPHTEEIQIHSRRYLMQVSAHRNEKRITGAILTVSDVTDLRRAERAAAEQGQRARSLIETATDGIIIANSRGLIHVCNPAACDLMDLRESDIVGKRADRLFRNRDVNIRPLVQHLTADAPTEAPKRFEITLVRCDRDRHIDVVLSEFSLDGETYRAATLREITELYEARESLAKAKKIAEQLNAAKTNFLTKMSHELRTPLNAIVGFSDAILNQIYGELQHERYLSYVADIHSSGVHLLGLINDVFDIAKIEAGMLRLNEEPVDIVKLVSSAVSFVGPLASKASVTVVFDFKTPAVALRADELRVRQVLLNVLSNAIKFSHRGGKVRVTVRPLDTGDLAVEIVDHGIGIEKHAIEMIGTEYVPPANIRGGDKEGSGLGLPVSIALMKAHGGTLLIESTPGRGTTVTLRFPAGRVLPAGRPNGAGAAHSTGIDGTGENQQSAAADRARGTN
jgi:two-component system CheB/CheR fusion protein